MDKKIRNALKNDQATILDPNKIYVMEFFNKSDVSITSLVVSTISLYGISDFPIAKSSSSTLLDS